MAGEVSYPAVPVVGAGGTTSAEVTLDARTGATTAVIAGRPFASRPQAGRGAVFSSGLLTGGSWPSFPTGAAATSGSTSMW